MTQDRMSTPAKVHQTRPNFFATEALRRARAADTSVSRPARRTFAEMLPGATRQPVLHLAPNVTFLPTVAQDDSCPLCGSWACDGTNCQSGAHAPAPAGVSVKAVA